MRIWSASCSFRRCPFPADSSIRCTVRTTTCRRRWTAALSSSFGNSTAITSKAGFLSPKPCLECIPSATCPLLVQECDGTGLVFWSCKLSNPEAASPDEGDWQRDERLTEMIAACSPRELGREDDFEIRIVGQIRRNEI